jgi:hypothetical protein
MSSLASAVFSQLTSLDYPSPPDPLPGQYNLQNDDGTWRIYPSYQEIADKVYPALIYQLENYEPGIALDGPDGTAGITLKITAVSNAYDQADAIGYFVADALDGTAGIWGTTQILGCFLTELEEDHFVDSDMESISYFEKTATFSVMFRK